MRRSLPHRHDVAHLYFGTIQREQSGRLLFHISDNGICLCHRFERLRLDLRRATGHDDAGIRAPFPRLPDRLTGLAHGFVGYGAAIDDDQVGYIAQLLCKRMAFCQVEPAPHGNDFWTAQPNWLQSAVPVKTWVAGLPFRSAHLLSNRCGVRLQAS